MDVSVCHNSGCVISCPQMCCHGLCSPWLMRTWIPGGYLWTAIICLWKWGLGWSPLFFTSGTYGAKPSVVNPINLQSWRIYSDPELIPKLQDHPAGWCSNCRFEGLKSWTPPFFVVQSFPSKKTVVVSGPKAIVLRYEMDLLRRRCPSYFNRPTKSQIG